MQISLVAKVPNCLRPSIACIAAPRVTTLAMRRQAACLSTKHVLKGFSHKARWVREGHVFLTAPKDMFAPLVLPNPQTQTVLLRFVVKMVEVNRTNTGVTQWFMYG